MNKFSTGAKSIDKLLDGGVLLGAPALIFGIPNLGKREIALNKGLSIQFLERPDMVTEFEKGYLAAFLDGEGTLDLHKLKKKSGLVYFLPRIKMSNLAKEPLEFINVAFGLKKKIYKCSYKINGKTKAFYELDINKRKDVKRILLSIKSHLKVKKAQAELLLKFVEHREEQQKVLKDLARNWNRRKKGQSSYTAKDFQFYQELKELNKRG